MSFPGPLVAALVAALVTNALTPAVRRMARRLGAIDYPGGRRVNTRPTPRLGGVAIYLGFLAAAVVAMVVTRPIDLVRTPTETFIRIPIAPRTDQAILGIMLGGTFLLLVGVYDDLRPMPPGLKFLAMTAAAAALIPFGLTTRFITHPLTGKTIFLGPWGVGLTMLWVVAVVNVINFIDGLDGLAAGIVAIAGTTLLLTAGAKGDVVSVTLAAALVGSALGFLRHNFSPARIFMGDSGSMFLGYVLGGLSVMGLYKSYTAISLIVPILALGVPIADTAFAIFRRARSGRPIYLPDRGHLHHRLLDRGLSQRQTVFLLYLVSALLGLGALALAGVNRPAAIITLGAIAAALIVGAQRMGLLVR
ncbi:MAG: MraY family glycosyltransferase [Armatimonadota bacterium]|nr:MraY family glycosyltransferase [Armatimonadota bacterium]